MLTDDIYHVINNTLLHVIYVNMKCNLIMCIVQWVVTVVIALYIYDRVNLQIYILT